MEKYIGIRGMRHVHPACFFLLRKVGWEVDAEVVQVESRNPTYLVDGSGSYSKCND